MRLILIHLLLVFPGLLSAQENCAVKNNAFTSGEEITYKIYYNWGKLWVGAGEVEFTVTKDSYRSKPVYYLKGEGSTYKTYDWFYKVRDTYESYIDIETLKPYRFKRDVLEGSYTLQSQYLFDHKRNKAYSAYQRKEKPMRIDTMEVTPCTYDVLSIIYYTRSIDFSNYRPNDTIPITIMLDREVHQLYLRYLGKETYTTDEYGTFRCITFSPLLVKGTIFEGGEKMKVWVTDDENKIPVLIESPIVVGSIKAVVKNMKGIKNSMTAKVAE